MEQSLAMYTQPPLPWRTAAVDELICALDVRSDPILEPQQVINAVKQAFPLLKHHVITKDEIERRLRILDARVELTYFKAAPALTRAVAAAVSSPLSRPPPARTLVAKKDIIATSGSNERGKDNAEEEEHQPPPQVPGSHFAPGSGKENHDSQEAVTITLPTLNSHDCEAGSEGALERNNKTGLDELRRELEEIGDGLELSRAVKHGLAMQFSSSPALEHEQRQGPSSSTSRTRRSAGTGTRTSSSGRENTALIERNIDLVPEPLTIRLSVDSKRRNNADAIDVTTTTWSTMPSSLSKTKGSPSRLFWNGA